jgi:hypothetical protein
LLELNNLVKKRILFEDATSYYNKWVSGQAAREFATQKLSIKDIVKKSDQHSEQSPNAAKAAPVMPYPIPNAVTALGEVSISISNALGLFRTALKNPTVQEQPEVKSEVTTIINALLRASSELNNMFVEIQKKVER